MAEINHMAFSYAEATGILTVLTDAFLLSETPDREMCAKVFVKVVEENGNMPENVIKLKDEVKKKYNL